MLRSLTLAIAALTSTTALAAPADLIIRDAHIVTVDPRFSIAHAAAIQGGRFIAVGTDAEVLKTRGPNTRVFDLHGQTVLPGFNDTHVHLAAGKDLETEVDLTHVHSIKDIQAAISARARQCKPGEPIVGTRGWWEYQLAEGRLPTRADIDAVAPNNPVTVPGPHYVIANSVALKLAGVNRDTPDPQGGQIYKGPHGEPTGLLMDNAGRFVRKFIPKPTDAQQLAGMKRVLALVNSHGLTSVGDPSGSAEDAAMYRRLRQQGLLTVRVDFAYNVDSAEPLDRVENELRALPKPGNDGDGMFRADEIGETGLDGAELTALLEHDYPGKPGYRGLQKVPTEQFRRFAALVAKYGYRLRPHAVGDAAINEGLDAFEFANAQTPIGKRRWMIDHAFLLGPQHYDRVKRLGLIINSQYMHNYQLGALILKAWQRPLADRSEPYAEWLRNGIMFAGGSDGPISYHAEPLLEIYGEVTRGTGWGGRLGPSQGISREDAIRSVTINGSYTTFEEKLKGSIEPGKYADFVVLSDDILKVPAEKIRDLKVRATVLGGRTVYGQLK
ncbi:amidohydrolase [Sphingomonas flavescens]|uniref:amidohydrolase n=1 Tax=Sphingomonas flavescens TaxID=3132797 RepID=UPI0028050B71|nr:amidohydrolase [Sphingomonas limnosediminicola]